ncbi:GNAT family N-acetyltransferase [Actinoplanes italicus]|uniref:Acyl-CoA synthetase (NDP forming) n=1 Tax=Actinoplanes italicus TaxID=113567 RepID=A0A2T0KEP4_9ACTN|nr:bifunctional GNAT family N-acetyltransferase/acetate--CoA ligase family protein [Actinoplanes italicus]PRX21857.1 acyl-CoA synthetase (NDP forming) [Actinoplanes italicus]GIE29726.1 GNAT family N-acetyltransferase [Actinoplanes italicus]
MQTGTVVTAGDGTVPGARSEPVHALTADGGIVAIRPVRPEDASAVTGMYEAASAANLRLRFFAQPSPATLSTEVKRLCRPESNQHVNVLAYEGDTLVGVASAERLGDRPAAEFAVFVADRQHGRGIGTLLLEHLAARCRRHGITELIGEVLPGNVDMLRVARNLSSHARNHLDRGVVDVSVRIGDGLADPIVDERERTAERASLRALLSPSSVAVAGAGRRAGSVGRETLLSLVEYGFTGTLYAINGRGTPVGPVSGYRSLLDLPGPVDLLVIAVPADQVAGVLADGARAGAHAAVVLSAGFGEAGPDGRERQADLVRLARRHGIRLVGPNCLGVFNSDPRVRLAAGFAPQLPPTGGLAVAAQSGAVVIAALDHAVRTGTGLSTVVSLGNKADISGNDLIAYWYDDPETRAVALYLESFGNPRKFARTVRALARRKPVLALKSGSSVAGGRAGASHTAAAAAPAATVDALFAQAGVIRTETLGELLDTARLLTAGPLPAGPRLAVVSNSGGLNVLSADAAEQAGLQLPVAGPDRPENPLDLGAGATPDQFSAATETAATAGTADMLLLVVVCTRANRPADVLSELGRVMDRHPDLCAAAVVTGATGLPHRIGERGMPVYELPEQAVRALAHAAAYAAWRQRPLGGWADLPGIDRARAHTLVEQALATGPGWQDYATTSDILAAYGIGIVPAEVALDAGAAVSAAARIGGPVVLKSADPQLVHKSDTGGVRIGLADGAAVAGAFETVASAGRPGSGVLVQPQVGGTVELVAGLVHDPLFGSVVLLGLGGVRTDLLADRTLQLVPMTDLDAGRMWRSLRCAALLTGYRGTAPADTAALEDLLLRLGRLAEENPEIAELDLNPVFAGPDGIHAVDAKLRLSPVGDEPDPVLRKLREPG